MPRLVEFAGGLGDVVNRFNEIESLQKEVRTHIAAIEDLYRRISKVAGSTGSPRGGAAAQSKTSARPRGKRGALKAAIHKILGEGKAVTPADVVRRLPGTGYKSHSAPRVLYNTVYLSLTKDKAIQKTEGGFKLKAAPAKNLKA